MTRHSALFVTDANSLKLEGGGQQICTQEYLSVLTAAGFSLSLVPYQWDQRMHIRLKRKIWPQPYQDQLLPTLATTIAQEARTRDAKYVFLNVVDAAPLAPGIRKQLGEEYKIILLSHGLKSVDYLHELRARGGEGSFQKSTRSDLLWLSKQLVQECLQRNEINHVFCLAPFEVEIERWLGAKSVSWLPRTIPDRPLKWRPHGKRLGFVGTVDHPPNHEGLLLFLRALEKENAHGAKVRLVGQPANVAAEFAARFPTIVEYLGHLSNIELEAEASTWSCFLHPLFCYAHGSSTKLAVGLGWQLPVVTTPAGCRGYIWRAGTLPLADNPQQLARLALEMLKPEMAAQVRNEVILIVRSSPSPQEVAAQAAAALF